MLWDDQLTPESDFLPALIRESFGRGLQFLWPTISVYRNGGIFEPHWRLPFQDSPPHWGSRRGISTPNLETVRCTGLRFHLKEA